MAEYSDGSGCFDLLLSGNRLVILCKVLGCRLAQPSSPMAYRTPSPSPAITKPNFQRPRHAEHDLRHAFTTCGILQRLGRLRHIFTTTSSIQTARPPRPRPVAYKLQPTAPPAPPALASRKGQQQPRQKARTTKKG